MPSGVSLDGGFVLTDDDPMAVSIPRPASYTYLPLSIESDKNAANGGIKRTFSENVLATFDAPERISLAEIDPPTIQMKNDSQMGMSTGRRKSFQPSKKPNITISKFALSARTGMDDTAYESGRTVKAKKSEKEPGAHSVTRSLSGFARKPWMSGSRSLSPSRRDGPTPVEEGSVSSAPTSGHPSNLSKVLHNAEKLENGEVSNSTDSLLRQGSVLSKKPRRPLSTFLQKTPTEPTLPRSPSFTSLRKSLSSDKLSTLSRSPLSSERVPPMPRSISDRSINLGLDMAKKKDELWTAFRNLDGDFQKYDVRITQLAQRY